jgi:hypothetical protein
MQNMNDGQRLSEAAATPRINKGDVLAEYPHSGKPAFRKADFMGVV